jgi:hypothetical protein
MQQILKPQSGTGFELNKGQKLKVIDLQGEQVSDLFCFRKADPTDALSSGRSIDYAETIFFTKGHILYSQTGLPVLRILEDTCGRHDFLVTPCSLQMFKMIHQNDRYHPSCLENLEKAFAGTGVNLHQIGTSFNIFMNVPVSHTGRITVECPLSKPGDFIVFEALEDLIVGLTACSDEGTNNGCCKPIAYEIQS